MGWPGNEVRQLRQGPLGSPELGAEEPQYFQALHLSLTGSEQLSASHCLCPYHCP